MYTHCTFIAVCIYTVYVWHIRVYGVEEKLLKAVQSFYIDSRACVCVGNDVSGFWSMLDWDSVV